MQTATQEGRAGKDPMVALPTELRHVINGFVAGVLDYEPVATIDRVVLFGSAAQGNWKDKSDVDLAVVVAEDPQYSYNELLKQRLGSDAQIQLYVCGVQHITESDYTKKLHITFCIPSDFDTILNRVNDGRGPLSKAINNGKVLYARKK